MWFMRGSALTLPRPAIYAIKKPKGLGGEYQVAGANRRFALRFIEKSRVRGCHRSAVAQLYSLGHMILLRFPDADYVAEI